MVTLLQRRIVQFGCLSLTLATISCSGTNPNDTNPVSQYDREFDEPAAAGKDQTKLPSLNAELDLLQRATNAYDRGLYSVAKDLFVKLEEQYPGSYYAILAELKVADCLYYLGDYTASLTEYEEFLRLHPSHESIPYVHLQMANTFKAQYRGPEHDQAPLLAAVKRFQKLIEEYPHSEYAPLARRQLDACREDLAKHEAMVAHFYLKQGQHKASAGRFKELLINYPETQTAALVRAEVQELFADDPELLSTIGRPNTRLALSPKADALAPKTPMILDNDVVPARGGLPEYRAVAASSPTVAKRPPAPQMLQASIDGPSAEEGLTEFYCEDVDDSIIFSASFAQRPSVRRAERVPVGEAHHQVLIEAGIGKTAFHWQSFFCDTANASAVVTPYQNGVQIRFKLPQDRNFQYFVLDRPWRLIAVSAGKQSRKTVRNETSASTSGEETSVEVE